MKCRHRKEIVTWNRKPSNDGSEDGVIRWYGRCECGKRVFERYYQDESNHANEEETL